MTEISLPNFVSFVVEAETNLNKICHTHRVGVCLEPGCCECNKKEPIPRSNGGLRLQRAISVTGLGVRGANQAPGTRSQAALLVAAPPGTSTHKGRGGESQAEGLPTPTPPHPSPIVRLWLAADCTNSRAVMYEEIKLTAFP